MLYRYSFDSPVGCLRLEEEDGYLTGLILTRSPSVRYADDTDLLRQTEQQLTEYFAGSRTSFSIPLKLQGTDFQKRVWKVLQTIPYAKTMSYGQVAALAGNPKACRAVGMANNRNPVAHHCALSSGHRCKRRNGRLRRRTVGQGKAAEVGAGCPESYSRRIK